MTMLFIPLHYSNYCISNNFVLQLMDKHVWYVHVNPPYILPQRPDEQIEIFVVARKIGYHIHSTKMVMKSN